MFDLLLSAALALGLIATLVYALAYSWNDGHGPWRSLTKTLALLPLGLLWLITALIAGEPGWAMAAGLLLGVLGDFLLSRPGEKAFLAGMAAFGLGHVVYALALFGRAEALGLPGFGGGQFWGLAALAALALSTENWLSPHTGSLRWPVRAYVLVIALLGAVAVILPSNPGQQEIQMGVTLFLISDLLLALRMFRARSEGLRRALGLMLWPAYVLGQLLIAWGSLLYWTFPQA